MTLQVYSHLRRGLDELESDSDDDHQDDDAVLRRYRDQLQVSLCGTFLLFNN